MNYKPSVFCGKRSTTAIMKQLSFAFVTISCLLCFVEYASSIMCYDCNSAFDPRCGENFDPFSLGVINCSLRDPPEHLNVGEPQFCRSIKMEIDGNVRVVRQCGYIAEEHTTGTPCRRVVGNGDLFVTYCSCNTDLCNSADANQRGLVFVSVLFLILNCIN